MIDFAGPSPSAVLLDLDGTVTDSSEAITAAVAESLREAGYPELPQRDLLRFAGPPLREGFATIGGVPVELADDMVRLFRSHYRDRMLDVPVYDGMRELLADLEAAGIPVAVATSKVGSMAKRILSHLELDHHFVAICGAADDETGGSKAEVVSAALRALDEAGADLSAPIMVGDRQHDIAGAATHGIPTILAGWGFGEPGEERGAFAVAADVPQLASLLLAQNPGG